MYKTLIFTISIIFASPVFAGTLYINSNHEETNIHIRGSDDSDNRLLGKTPFTIELDDLSKNYIKSSSFILTLNKEGFEPYRLLVTPHSNTDIVLNINMEVSKDIRLTKQIDTLVDGLFASQRLIRGKNYDEAMKKLDSLEDKFSQFSSIFEIKGSVYYLKKDFPKALSFYRKAFSINPNNLDAYRMKVYLEEHLTKGKNK